MMMLELIDEYGNFTIFKQPFPRFAIITWWLQVEYSPLGLITLLELAKDNKRYGFLISLWLLGNSKKIVRWFYKKIDSRLIDEARYKIRERFYNIPQVADSNDHP